MLIQNGDHTWLCFKNKREIKLHNPALVITQSYEKSDQYGVFTDDDLIQFKGEHAYQDAVCYCDQVIGKLIDKKPIDDVS